MKVISYFKRVLLAALGLSKVETAAAAPVAFAEIIEASPRGDTAPATAIATEAESTATVLALPLPATTSGFMLPARLASVSKLNTRSGRVPHDLGARRQGRTPVPAARLGAKRQRTGGYVQCIPAQRALARKSAIIIPFPVKTPSANMDVSADALNQAA